MGIYIATGSDEDEILGSLLKDYSDARNALIEAITTSTTYDPAAAKTKMLKAAIGIADFIASKVDR